jgi:two-component SAPR family response regulator
VFEALRLLADTRPDIAVVDITLKTGSGIDLIKRI